jgi:hypothetical protein
MRYRVKSRMPQISRRHKNYFKASGADKYLVHEKIILTINL